MYINICAAYLQKFKNEISSCHFYNIGCITLKRLPLPLRVSTMINMHNVWTMSSKCVMAFKME